MHIPIVNHSLKYNPSLDGLRGIAISLVLLFHIWPDYFSFGYVGVDIFFVLSGYLITQIIDTKLKAGTFSFKEFYRNRVRRIFPAMIVVLLAAFIVGYLFLFPSELEQLGRHIKSSAFFYQNFRLIDEAGYWDKAAELKPLLHFWSLSIEEQFYLFWPLLILLISKLRINLFYALSILTFLLLAIPLFLNLDNFFHSFARFWELSFGGLVYAFGEKIKDKSLSSKFFLPIALLFVIAIAFSYGNNEFSLSKTFFIVFASGLLIFQLKQTPTSRFFSANVLVFLGLISFPLYLWHYVIISYMHIFGIQVPKYGILIIFFSIVLSYLTYRYIEIYSRKQTSYIFASFLFVLVVAVGLLGQYTTVKKGFPNREHLISNEKFAKQFVRTPATDETGIALVTQVLGHKPHNNYVKATSSNLSKPFVAIIGDSHAHTSYPGFAQEFKKRGYETVLLANSSCPPYIGGAMGKNLKDLTQCRGKIDDIYAFIDKLSNLKKVVFVTRGPVYLYDLGYGVVENGGKPLNYHFKEFYEKKSGYIQKELFFKRAEETFEYFEKYKKFKLYYLLENPELGFSPKNCMERPFGIFSTNCKITLASYMERAREYRENILKISNKFTNVTILDPKNLYCDRVYCYAVKDGKMLYADDDHHSVDGSIEQAKYMMDKIINDF